MEQIISGASGLADSYMLEWLAAVALILVAVAMSLFDLPGNTLMVGSSLGFAFYDPSKYFDIRIISAVILIYALGEIWEFVLSFFGIKRQARDISWWGVLFIGCGTFVGTVMGTTAFPVAGSVFGGAIGAFVMAYLYEYLRSHNMQHAGMLAWQAAKMQFVAMLGKLVATFVLAILLAKQIFFYA
ncbi:MAG: DUF456 family protein [Succiniclasticum sp.]|uniref:DUF456 family protein n=1 Tax=Succiniclasticum sp. TaxID=2775030 RepID=UPI002A90E60C|nr:DUF456 family protein [Succiniclasticum sp.]MDY6291453.1 DUF456 family protein [Succiniclasticum sp.]